MVQPVAVEGSLREHKDAPVLQPSYANLLQELTYALAGITGDVFVDSVDSGPGIRSPKTSAFKVNPEVDWLSSCDKKQIECILALGFHYYEIDCFVQQQPSTATTGVCWQGLRAGLEGVLLICSGRNKLTNVHMCVVDILWCAVRLASPTHRSDLL